MTNPYKTDIDGIGTILFEPSKRARRVIIYIRPLKSIRVAVPARISFQKALAFVYLKKQWILKQVARIEQTENRGKALAKSFLSIDKDDATKILTARLRHLAELHGFKYDRVSIRNQRTRWGSCSHKNDISLNMKLVMLPEDLTDYVILHELVHTRIHDHSKKFWEECDKYIEDARAAAKRLKTIGLAFVD
jgi:predicted metal-dependent hydrolase